MLWTHSAWVRILFFQQNSIEVLQWPVLIPDLNPIEYMWGNEVQPRPTTAEVHPSWMFGFIYLSLLSTVSFIQCRYVATFLYTINADGWKSRCLLSSQNSSEAVMYCWQTYAKYFLESCYVCVQWLPICIIKMDIFQAKAVCKLFDTLIDVRFLLRFGI